MDDFKDIQKGEKTSKFLDEKSIRTQAFGKNISGERAYRRAERIVAALHLLSRHVDPEEPVRASLRSGGLTLLRSIIALRDEMRAPGSESYKEALGAVRYQISLVRMLFVSGFVSAQNAEIVIDALDELGNFLVSSQRTLLSESVTFTREELLSAGTIAARSLMDKKDTAAVKDKTHRVSVARPDSSVSDRSGAILSILKTQGECGIKDISISLPEYSEKMIQRELARLIDLGKVKKAGFKRWSKYILIEQSV